MTCTATSASSTRDHPREYGENEAAERALVAARGSSPRIRGKFDLCSTPRDAGGIIPANTGKISFSAAADTPPRDHPREYGENGFAYSTLP